MAIRKGDRRLMRELNNAHVLRVIRAEGPISRVEISEKTGLGLSTVSNIVNELFESKILLEVGEGDSSGGRKPNMLDLNYSARYIFGVKIGAGQTWIALTDLRGTLLELNEFAFPIQSDPSQLLLTISDTIKGIIRQRKLLKSALLGIGVGVSGLVSSETGVCLYSPILHWKEIPLKTELERMTRLPVMVENDVNTFAYGKLQLEFQRKVSSLICVTTGIGVGAGIVIDGKMYRGHDGGAGEFGHVSIDIHGPVCSCGRKGCLDVLASDQYLLQRAHQLAEEGQSLLLQSFRDSNNLSPDAILSAAQAGDPAAKQIYREMASHLGHGIANLVNLFNPEKIVIGGEGIVAAPLFIETVRQTVEQAVFPRLNAYLEISLDDGREDTWLQGAAFLVIENFFEMPLYEKESILNGR